MNIFQDENKYLAAESELEMEDNETPEVIIANIPAENGVEIATSAIDVEKTPMTKQHSEKLHLRLKSSGKHMLINFEKRITSLNVSAARFGRSC
jgi:hypothetical protein